MDDQYFRPSDWGNLGRGWLVVCNGVSIMKYKPDKKSTKTALYLAGNPPKKPLDLDYL